MSRVVLVTGVSGGFASRFARLLADLPANSGIERVVGIDTVLPANDLGKVKFVRADIRTPVVGKVIAVEEVDTVVHLDLNPPLRGRGTGAKELNVIGTMQLLAACQRSDTVNKLVLQSSTAFYGTSSKDPAMFSEAQLARGGVKAGFPKDVVEVESYTRGFARRRPDVLITTLRSAQVLSSEVDTPIGQYLTNPVIPSAIGFDPRLQFVHLDDALGVLREAVVKDRPGTFNVAGDGVILLSQMARRLRRPLVPLPGIGFASAMRRVIRAMGSDTSPDLHRLLMFGRVVETKALAEIFGYDMLYSTAEVFDEFRLAQRPGIMSLGVRA